MGKIIAIVGMCGSGKSVACDYLENLGYKKVYFGGVTMDKLKEIGLEITPDNEKMMREKLRQDLGMGAYAKVLLSKIKELSINNDAIKRDVSEIENIAKAGPIAYADYYIFNNGTINDFHNRLAEILSDLGSDNFE